MRGRNFALALVTALGSAGAFAQANAVPSFNLERLELDPSAIGSLVMGSGRTLPEGSLRVALALHYENDPLVAYAQGQRLGAAVRDRLTLHLLVAYAVTDWLELGAQLPGVIYQSHDDLSGAGIAPPAVAGLETPQLSARFALLRSSEDGPPVDLALHVGLGFPIGSAPAVAGDPTFTFTPELLLSKQWGPVLASAEVGAFVRPQAVSVGSTLLQSQLTLGASVSTTGEGLRGELTLRSSISFSAVPNGVELLGGLRYPLSSSFQAFLAGGPGLTNAPGSPAFRLLAGIAYGYTPVKMTVPPPLPPPEVVKVDPCAPGQAHTPAQCPELDDDGDGIKNGLDACPLEKGVAEFKGCPVPDRDHDGVPDAIDKCPDEPGPKERQGCPFHDRDNDGLEDSIDACPDQPGPPETRGCPVKDTDGDGVPDHLDNCPNEPGPASNQGCPVQQHQLVQITKDKLVIKDKVYFDTAKAVVLRKSFPLLDQVAQILNEHKNIPLVTVEGHTDNRGSAEVNRRLSLARAEAVRVYLVHQGVDPTRLDARGYGPDRPAAVNITAKGRETNRRVEFTIGDAPAEQLEPLTPLKSAPPAPSPAAAPDAGRPPPQGAAKPPVGAPDAGRPASPGAGKPASGAPDAGRPANPGAGKPASGAPDAGRPTAHDGRKPDVGQVQSFKFGRPDAGRPSPSKPH